jgi:hypothetical protein
MGFIAFAIVGLVIWAGQRLTHAAAKSNYAQSISREVDYQVPDPNQPSRNTFSTGLTQNSFAPPMGRISNAPVTIGALPPVDKSLVTGPFIGMDIRKAAKDSIRPVHDLLDLIRRYDSKGLWNQDTTAATVQNGNGNASGPTVVTVPGGTDPVLLPGQNPMVVNAGGNATRGATFQGGGTSPSLPVSNNANSGSIASAIVTIDHIHMRTDSLGTQTDMTLPPEQFPAPLRPDVKAVSQEIHSYLKDADLAATADAATRAQLRAQASIRLAAAQRLYEHMNGVIDGTADVNRPPSL